MQSIVGNLNLCTVLPSREQGEIGHFQTTNFWGYLILWIDSIELKTVFSIPKQI